MTTPTSATSSRPTVLVVGAGFAGFHALRGLEKKLDPDAADLVVVNPTDYLLYSPLLPDATAGVVEPRHIAISLHARLKRTRIVLGQVTAVDTRAQTVTVELIGDGGRPRKQTTIPYDRLVLTPGAITRQFDIPGLAEHAHGVKTITEAMYLRDHLLTQMDLADALPDTPDGRRERQERLCVVAVGAGYTGTEIVAQLQYWLSTMRPRWNHICPEDVRWLLIDVAKSVLPELGPDLGAVAMRVLHRRGIEVRLGVSIEAAKDNQVTLTDGDVICTRTLIWGAGIAASPLIATLGLPVTKGRLDVDPQLRVPGLENVWAAGDSASVPDLTKTPRDGQRPPTPPTAQHAQRHGAALARNVAASLGVGQARAYRHKDLGLVADLGGKDAVARPLGLKLSGRLAKIVARGYHLYALPAMSNRARVGTDWLLSAILSGQSVQLSAVSPEDAAMAAAQRTRVFSDQ